MPSLDRTAYIPTLDDVVLEHELANHRQHWDDIADERDVLLVAPVVVSNVDGCGPLVLSIALHDWDRPVDQEIVVRVWNVAVEHFQGITFDAKQRATIDRATRQALAGSERTLLLLGTMLDAFRRETAAGHVACYISGMLDGGRRLDVEVQSS